MSFDQDPNEQAQISAGDFALMCDEMKQLKERNAELLAALNRYYSHCDAMAEEMTKEIFNKLKATKS